MLALLILLACLSLAAAQVLPTLVAAMLAAVILFSIGLLDTRVAAAAIDVPILLTIAAAFGLAEAIRTTGIATTMAEAVVMAAQDGGRIALVVAVFAVTSLLSTMLSNAATVAVMYPVVLSISLRSNGMLPLKPALLTLMAAASASFATIHGYQTN